MKTTVGGITIEGTPEEFIIFLSLQKSPGTEPQKKDCPSQPKIEKYVPLVTCCGCDGKFPRKELCRGRCLDCRNKKKVTQEDQQNQLENVSVAEDRDSKKISLPEEDAKRDACCNRCQGSLDNPKSDYCADCAEIINPKYMMDHHLLTYASTLIKVKNLKSPADINQKDSRLYKQLVSRNLLSKLDFSKLENPSPNQSKSTVGQCASCGCTSELIEGKCEDCKPKVNHKIETNGKRDFANAVNDELITYAKKIIKEKGIESRSDLQRKDQGLYVTLSKRNLLDLINLDSQGRRVDYAHIPTKHWCKNCSSMHVPFEKTCPCPCHYGKSQGKINQLEIGEGSI